MVATNRQKPFANGNRASVMCISRTITPCCPQHAGQRQKRNSRCAQRRKEPKFHVFAGLGQGALGDAGLDAVLDVLREIDYQGWIVGELDSTDKTPREGNQENFDWLQKHLKADEIVK